MSMEIPRIRRMLLLAMVVLAVGALTLHLRVHQLVREASSGRSVVVFANVTAALFGILDVFAVTQLFRRRETAVYGYLLNGMLVIFGTVFMTHFGWSRLPPGSAFWAYLAHPTMPDILIAWSDFLLGAVLFNLWQKE